MAFYNIISKEEMKPYVKLTKKGEPYKDARIDWEKYVEKVGNILECHFGHFEFIKHEIIEKVHYWTVKNIDTNRCYKIKRDQMRKNKKMPKNAVEIELEIKTDIKVPHITKLFPMPLLLVAPKEFDLKEYCMNIINEFISKQTKKRDKERAKRVLIDSLDRKGHTNKAYIQSLMIAAETMTDGGGKRCARELLKIYHPDTGCGDVEITKLLIFYLK